MMRMSEWLMGMTPGDREYTLKYLPKHMAEAGKKKLSAAKKLDRFLTDFEFIQAKISTLSSLALLTDYELALHLDVLISEDKKEALKLLQGAIRLSATTLTNEPDQLATQLFGRLLHDTQTEKAEEPRSLFYFPDSVENFIMQIGAQLSVWTLALIIFPLSYLSKFVSSIQKNILFYVPGFSTDENHNGKNFQKIIPLIREVMFGLFIASIVGLQMGLKYAFVLFINVPLAVLRPVLPLPKMRRKHIRSPSKLKQEGSAKILEKVLIQAQASHTKPWLRPLAPNMMGAGGALAGKIEVETDSLIAIIPRTQNVVAISGQSLIAWDLQTQAEVNRFDYSSEIHSFTIIGEGDQLVFAAKDKTLNILDLKTWDFEKQIQDPNEAYFRAIAAIPNSNKFISGYKDRPIAPDQAATLIVWDAASGKICQTLVGHMGDVAGIAVSPDGQFAISASNNKTLIVWDLQTGCIVQTLIGHTDKVTAVVITPDGELAISSSVDQKLIVWDFRAGEIIQTQESDSIRTLAITPDGQHLISGSEVSTMKVWWIYNSRVITVASRFEHPGTGVESIAVTSDSKFAVSRTYEMLKVWDLDPRKKEKNTLFHSRHINAVATSPDGRVAVSASNDWTLVVWDIQTGIPLKKIELHGKPVTAVAIAPDSKQAISSDDNGGLILWDLRTGLPLKYLKGHKEGEKIDTVLISPDGQTAISTQGHRRFFWDLTLEARLKDLSLIQEMDQYMRGDTLNVEAIFPDGKTIVSTDALWINHKYSTERIEEVLIIWDIVSGEKLQTIVVGKELIESIAVTPDDRHVIAAAGKEVKIWDWQRGVILKTLTCNNSDYSEVKAVAVSPDGKCLVSTSSDGTIAVWDLSSGQVMTRFKAESGMRCCAFSSDGRTIVAGDFSGQMHFFKLELPLRT
jgi:WD40 repeat protein